MTNVIPLFSTPVYQNQNEDLITPELLNFVQSQNYLKFNIKNNGQMTQDTYILDRPEMHLIKKYIADNLYEYVHNVLGYDLSNMDAYFLNSWITRHDKGDSSLEHLHTNSIISGTFYIQSDQDSGDLVFKNPLYSGIFPSAIEPDIHSPNMFNSSQYTAGAKTGNLVLFPSNLLHYTYENNSNRERYCLAFNIWFKGKFGYSEAFPQISLLDIK